MDSDGLHFATTSMCRSMIPVSDTSSMSQTVSHAEEAGAMRMQEFMIGRQQGINHGVPPPLLGTTSSYATSRQQRLGSSGPLMANKVAGSASSGVLALQGTGTAGGMATSDHCSSLAQFSSDPGFAERAAKFSSFSNGGNYYSLTPYALAPDHRCKPRGSRSIAAGDNNNNDGKLSRSSSCSRLANLAPSSCITTERMAPGSADSKSPEINKAYQLKDESTAMEYDGKKQQQQQPGGVVGGGGNIALTEAFEGATEIDGGSDPNDTDEADGLEYSSCYQQAYGDRIEKGKKLLQQADKGFHREPGGDSILVSSGGREGQAAVDGDEIKAKRQRSWESTKEDVKLRPDRACSESYSGGDSSPLSMKESCKPSELPKQDYIHVRARRGQATDSHSLAERVTGKAMMLDEIINYVQSLQRQVEFLSMKLASVNPRLDFDVENFLAKEMQSHASTTMMMGPNPTAMLYGHHQQPQQHQAHNLQSFEPSGLDFTPAKSASEACIRRTMSAPVAAPWSCSDAFADNLSQLSSKWEGELQSVVHTGFLQGKPNAWLPQEVHCQIPATHMKSEL
ncbi:hypothetical protein BDL97_01G157800 [Sphagnum fallax]|nr:hypothetical protein BDL97_01G157800 [Sphagnum fallax]